MGLIYTKIRASARIRGMGVEKMPKKVKISFLKTDTRVRFEFDPHKIRVKLRRFLETQNGHACPF